jgi:hypothetical protein
MAIARLIIHTAVGTLFGFLACAQQVKAEGCEDGAITTITGEVGEIFQNKAGTWTIPVARGGSECFRKLHAPVIISDDRPPSSCRREQDCKQRYR